MADVFIPELGASFDVYKQAVRSNEAPFRMWLCLGQSNMSGGNTGALKLKGQVDATLANIYTLDNDNKIVPGRLPFPSDALDIPTYVGDNNNVSLSMSFAKALATASTADRILIVHCAFPGSSFSQPTLPAGQWRSTNTTLGSKLSNNLYDRTIAKANAAITQGAVLEGILWCQGENDAELLTEVQYNIEFTAFVTDLRANIANDINGGHTQKPLIVISMPAGLLGTGQTGVFPLGGASTISEAEFLAIENAKRAYCRTKPYTAYVESLGLAGDPLHYSAAEVRAMGIRCYNAIDRAKRNVRSESVAATELPTFWWNSLSGHGARLDVGEDNIRASGWKGVALSDFISNKLSIVGGFNGDGTVDMPLAFDGVHAYSRNASTTAGAGFSAVTAQGGGVPEWRLRCDGINGVLGIIDVVGSPTTIEVFRNGTSQFVFDATNGDIECKTAAKGIILKSANNSRWRVTVNNAGALVVTAI